jgi:hypothetical protein
MLAGVIGFVPKNGVCQTPVEAECLQYAFSRLFCLEYWASSQDVGTISVSVPNWPSSEYWTALGIA